MTAAEIAKEILDAITSGLTGLVSAIPTAIKDTFDALFLTTTGTGEGATQSISTFAIVMLRWYHLGFRYYETHLQSCP